MTFRDFGLLLFGMTALVGASSACRVAEERSSSEEGGGGEGGASDDNDLDLSPTGPVDVCPGGIVLNGACQPCDRGTYEGDFELDDASIGALAGYTRVTGELRPGRPQTGCSVPLTSLAPLGCLKRVGRLSLSNTPLEDLSGLDALTTVDGDLLLGDYGCPSGDFKCGASTVFRSLHGLGALTRIGGDLAIGCNPDLVSVAALGHLTSVGGSVHIVSTALTTLAGLGALQSIGAPVYAGMPLSLEIAFNNELADIDALLTTTSFGPGGLDIERNTALPTCAANNLAAHFEELGWSGPSTIEENGYCIAH